MVYHRRCVWAQGIIVKFFRGWQVRREYRAKFRAIAGPKIVAFLQKALVSLTQDRRLPTESLGESDSRSSPSYRKPW